MRLGIYWFFFHLFKIIETNAKIATKTTAFPCWLARMLLESSASSKLKANKCSIDSWNEEDHLCEDFCRPSPLQRKCLLLCHALVSICLWQLEESKNKSWPILFNFIFNIIPGQRNGASIKIKLESTLLIHMII